MRLMQRTTVDLPEPDGPISAVASLAGKSIERSLIVRLSPYQAFSPCRRTVPARRAGSFPRLAVTWGTDGVACASVAASGTDSEEIRWSLMRFGSSVGR